MNRMIMTGLASLVIATATAANADATVRQLTIESGKGVTFQLGRQFGAATFHQESGACGLSVSISMNAAQESMSGMSGMSGSMAGAAENIAPTMKVQVMPARPAQLSTPDGKVLVFNCGPDGKQMFLDMPNDFKFTNK